MRRRVGILGFVLALAGALVATTPAGTFTIDDSNYLATVVALRSRSLALPGPDAFGASPEWYAFDPFPPQRGAPTVPVMPTAPPLWAPFALPFFVFGLRGLIFLNALSFALTIVLVHRLTAMYSAQRWTPAIAAAVFALGSYSLEYAQGIWPHMFSVLMVTAAVFFAARARLAGDARWAAAAGLVAAIAAGVRYQNVALVLALFAGLALIGQRRLRMALAFAAGACGPLLVSASINLHRLGIFHPATKGRGYATAGAMMQSTSQGRLFDAALSFWSRVVDFSVHPPIPAASGFGPTWMADPDLGVFLAQGAVKKALFQSAPWVALAWLFMLIAWRHFRAQQGAEAETRAQSLLAAALVGAFTLAGTGAHDGLCFNARYLLELLPGAAVVLAWQLERQPSTRKPWLVGALLGAALVALAGFAEPGSILRSGMIRFVPLVLASVAVGMALLRRRLPAALPAMVSLCTVWAFGLHLLDDLPASHRMRRENAQLLAEARATLPKHCGLFVYGIERDALWPVWGLDDCLVVDLGKDGGRDGPRLARALLEAGRRVFVQGRVPRQTVQWMLESAQLAERPVGPELSELTTH